MENKGKTVFIVDDDISVRDSLTQMLSIRGYQVIAHENGKQALASKDLYKAHCFLVDIRMPGISGLEVLQNLKENDVHAPVVIITGHGDVSTAVEAMKKGAYDFIEKPFEKEILLACIARATEKTELLLQKQSLQQQLENLTAVENHGILGKSKVIEEVLRKINNYAKSPSSVLVTGETGTGKELVARALHKQSLRKGRFVAVNMATIMDATSYNELFGHEKGSFTGAVASHEGKFEYANGGTIFLDEIDSLSPRMQAVLLRVLEEKTFCRLGSNKEIKVDVRIIAATNQNLEKLIEEGEFRRDLYHRLKAVSIELPPLKQRSDDIELLGNYFLQECCKFYNREILSIAPDVIYHMKSYSWPGNVRELKNMIEVMVLNCEGETIIEWPLSSKAGDVSGEISASDSLREAVDSFEREYISQVLQKVSGNLKKAAEDLQVSPRTLFDKMRKLELQKEDFKG